MIEGDLRGEVPQIAHTPEPKASELEEIKMKITHLKHKKKRTHGTTVLYQEHKNYVSRRQFQCMVKEERKLQNTQFSEKMTRIKWRITNSCWAFDDTFYAKDSAGNKTFIHNIKDLATQYILPPLAGEFACGEEVANNLERLFIQFGPPMFLKRDNGSNLNHHEVNQLLERYHVIAINSPTYYSKYNGSIEQSNCQLKDKVEELAKEMNIDVSIDNILPLSRLAAHELNAQKKKSIKGRPVVKFLSELNQSWKNNTKTKRKELFHEVMKLTQEKIDALEKPSQKALKKCRRKAAEEILVQKRFIDVYSK